jgi:phospholipid/cholesterol/gamma-HCH transport system substrate-binding protein
VSRSLSRWQALMLGLVVLAGAGLGGLGLFVVGSRVWPGRHDLHVHAAFAEIRGVEVGARVRIQGIDAGEVVGIAAPGSPHDPVVLRLRVRQEYRHLVRASSTVQIVSEGMLGGKVVEVRPPARKTGQPEPEPAAEGEMLAGTSAKELGDVLGDVGEAIEGVRNGDGTIGKLVRDPQVYEALVGLIRASNEAVEKSKDTMSSIQRDADALKRVPILGGYIDDPLGLLVRPSHERTRKVFPEADLFEPGRAVLLQKGKDKLDELASWFGEMKQKGSEVVVVSYADPKAGDAKAALAVSRQQSEAVAEYLKSSQKIHKLGWFTWRKVVPLGMGTQAPPQRETEPLPPARTEVVVFIPQS